jgi:hypothetical protein
MPRDERPSPPPQRRSQAADPRLALSCRRAREPETRNRKRAHADATEALISAPPPESAAAKFINSRTYVAGGTILALPFINSTARGVGPPVPQVFPLAGVRGHSLGCQDWGSAI